MQCLELRLAWSYVEKCLVLLRLFFGPAPFYVVLTGTYRNVAEGISVLHEMRSVISGRRAYFPAL